MNIEQRLEFLRTEKAKILGLIRSHLRSVEMARRLYDEVERKVSRPKLEIESSEFLRSWLWKHVSERCDELLRKQQHFQFRVFDEGAIKFLDEEFVSRRGNPIDAEMELVKSALGVFPEKARDVLHLQYRRGLSCVDIAGHVALPVDEVYQIWQHSMIYLWEKSRESGSPGVREQEDEAFWTFALRYLDGTASEKFVAELNSEIHANKSRIKEYNDLRVVDGIMIAFGATSHWPGMPDERGGGDRVSLEDRMAPAKEHAEEAISSAAAWLGGAGDAGAEFFSGIAGKVKSVRMPKLGKSPEEGEDDFTEPAARESVTAVEESRPSVGATPAPRGSLAGIARETTATQARRKPEKRRRKETAGEATETYRAPGRAPRPNLLWLGGGVLSVLLVILIFELISPWWPTNPRVLRQMDVVFSDEGKPRGFLGYRTYAMTSGTMRFRTSAGIEAIVEAPAEFAIQTANRIDLRRGRLVVTVPERAKGQAEVETRRFKIASRGGEIGLIAEDEGVDVVVFTGEAELSGRESEPFQVPAGAGLRFRESGDPVDLSSTEEAHRYPDLIPVIPPKAGGGNLVANPSFETGPLSRSCKNERLYRDIPSGWEAGWQKDGKWAAALEQHSGTVQITDAIGGLPAPVHGERYLWINHGFVSQNLRRLERGARYRLSVRVASHRNFGPGAEHMADNVGGNRYRFGVWQGKGWVTEVSGQLEAAQPFRELTTEFTYSPAFSELAEGSPILMLTGETRIFYDDVVLKKVGGDTPAAAGGE